MQRGGTGPSRRRGEKNWKEETEECAKGPEEGRKWESVKKKKVFEDCVMKTMEFCSVIVWTRPSGSKILLAPACKRTNQWPWTLAPLGWRNQPFITQQKQRLKMVNYFFFLLGLLPFWIRVLIRGLLWWWSELCFHGVRDILDGRKTKAGAARCHTASKGRGKSSNNIKASADYRGLVEDESSPSCEHSRLFPLNALFIIGGEELSSPAADIFFCD